MASKSSNRGTSTVSNAQEDFDAISLLTEDHKKVKTLFKEFEERHEKKDADGAAEIATQICNELSVHASLEEELFYPAVRKAMKDGELINEAEVEHASAKELIAQIESMDGSEEKFAATVTVLGEYIDHHVKEEQNEIFPQAKKAKVDMNALGEKMMERKQELLEELGLLDDDEVDEDEDDGAGSERQRATETK